MGIGEEKGLCWGDRDLTGSLVRHSPSSRGTRPAPDPLAQGAGHCLPKAEDPGVLPAASRATSLAVHPPSRAEWL